VSNRGDFHRFVTAKPNTGLNGKFFVTFETCWEKKGDGWRKESLETFLVASR
jgi:hypothetical protein